MNGFHTQKNLYFVRQDDGGVKVVKYPDDTRWGIDGPDAAPLLEQVLDGDTWCSVISSMSAGGEQDLRFFAAKRFHQSAGSISVTAADEPHRSLP